MPFLSVCKRITQITNYIDQHVIVLKVDTQTSRVDHDKKKV